MCEHQICKQILADIVIATQAETPTRAGSNLRVMKGDSDASR